MNVSALIREEISGKMCVSSDSTKKLKNSDLWVGWLMYFDKSPKHEN